ncbi:Uncharacterised protein [Metamycoplasma arthritidis]|uniref:Uncharacterized protein n=1 Tax=Metamycoplasma arthritidis (strain 158L3-1) TaxID=243272 RepID=B3PLT9_META1|nr:hypothetical protein [Metamycoplasma arthritidis]ACF06991.1 conserved hypothetical protein [Metamycoplasma arthritidis 158L3-1]VEU78520.1 Uncharacterised protein [Metamycoplasma arthritidis]
MSLKPIYSGDPKLSPNSAGTATLTNRLIEESIQTRALSHGTKLKDPAGVIPNGIYKVFEAEQNLKWTMIVLNAILFTIALVSVFLFAYKPNLFVDLSAGKKISWAWYLFPAFAFLISIYFIVIESIELMGIKKSVVAYRESINSGSTVTPPFISILYYKLSMTQVKRTWIVVAILFYMGLYTIIFWALQDAKWGILDFDKWIHASFPNPNAVVYMLCGIMATVLILYIINTFFRKKRMVDIQSFFGNEVIDYNDLQDKKTKANRFYAKIFFISVLVLLILPFILYIILKKFVLKGKS